MGATQLIRSLKGEKMPAIPILGDDMKRATNSNMQEVCDCIVPDECAEC